MEKKKRQWRGGGEAEIIYGHRRTHSPAASIVSKFEDNAAELAM